MEDTDTISNKLYTRLEGDVYYRKGKEGGLGNNDGVILNKINGEVFTGAVTQVKQPHP